MSEIRQGDIIRLPQKVVLFSYDDDGNMKGIWTCPKPLAAVYLETKMLSGTELAALLLDNELWYTEPENLHQWREHASQINRSV